MAYPQVEADLPNQPGGTGPNAEPGSSVTIVPMILLRNPGRNDGGVAARFAPIFAIFGIDTATNDFDVQTDGTAVLVPVKVDATVQNDLLSDFAAWPNPVTLLNNAAAFAFPTYILRGSDLSGVGLSDPQSAGCQLGGEPRVGDHRRRPESRPAGCAPHHGHLEDCGHPRREPRSHQPTG